MFRKNLRPVWATLAVVAIIGILFSFAPVRAAASQFLGLFRVRKFAVVPIDPVALSGDLDSAEAQEQIAKVFSDDVDIMREPSEPISVTTAEEASQLAGLPLRLPAVLAAPDSLEVQDGLELSYRFNAERARAVLDVIGKEDVKIPDGLDGAVIHVDVRPIVAAMFESEKESVMLIQANSPIMDMPPSLDMNYMGEALLQLWGLSPDEARDMAAKIDWTSTLVIPLPAGVASHQEVMVKGEPGLFIQQTEAEHGEQISTLLWQKDGVVYALTGELTIERAQEIANSMP